MVRYLPLVVFLIGLSLFAAACQQDSIQTSSDNEVIIVTRMVGDNSETVEIVVTQLVVQENIVTQVVVEERLVTPTPTPLPTGGEIITASLADIRSLNPVLSNDGASKMVIQQLFLSLLTLDPFSGAITPQLAQDWGVSADGLTYTFTLRPDVTWSDGTPLTAGDVAFTFAAITTPALNSPHLVNFTNINSWQVEDDHTLTVRLNAPDCPTLYAFTTGIVPAHVYDNNPGNISRSGENLAPTVVSGPFLFANYLPGQSIRLIANPTYYLGAPLVSGWQLNIYSNAVQMVNDLLAGQIDYTTVDAEFVARVESAMARGAGVQINKWFVNGFTYLAFNLANPNQPQNGWVDENESGVFTPGAPVQPQEPHPVLGDLAVRQAIAAALNYDELIAQAAYGQGGRVAADISPAIGWAYNDDLIPYTQDVTQAAALLRAAGWVVDSETGTRVKNGAPLALTLTVNAGNEARERLARLIAAQLESLGFIIRVEILPFEEAVLKLRRQTYDMAITGWLDTNPEPDNSSFLSYREDTVGVGFNFASYYNEAVENNLARGRAVPGCGAADRATFYQQNQELIYEDIPFIPLYAPLVNIVWNRGLQNLHPNGWNLLYNVHQWYVER